ncbi:MAG: methyltransferase domain-containing protein, partial [Chloroflexi bacterium]|nr:methyltransferase domain-containing protein [Chloroflexota bacterium]
MGASYQIKDQCRLCDSLDLNEVLSLTPTPLANSFRPTHEEAVGLERIPLALHQCGECWHTQLSVVVDANLLFREYLYVSGTSSVFRAHFREYARAIRSRLSAAHPFVVDIGSNDGTLLSAFAEIGCQVQGVDPASALAQTASDQGIPTISGFFDHRVRDQILVDRGSADLVTANNVCANVDDLRGLVSNVAGLLKPSGLFVFEVSYLADVVEDLLFDT